MNALGGVVLWTLMALVVLSGFGSGEAVAQQSTGAGQSAVKLPSDVDPDSFARIPRAKREDLTTEEERQAYDRLARADAVGQTGPLGPTGTRLHFPIVAEYYRSAVRWMREKTGIEPKYVELAILVATRETNGKYEWLAHEENAIKAGIARSTVEIVRNKQEPKGLDPREEVIIRFGREMHHEPKVTSKTFADAEKLFGRKKTLALTMIMAHYSGSGLLLHSYDLQLGPNQKDPFPAH